MSLLLCHIANSVGTSTEDIATMSLHYILQSSTAARDTLLDYIGTELGLQFEKTYILSFNHAEKILKDLICP